MRTFTWVIYLICCVIYVVFCLNHLSSLSLSYIDLNSSLHFITFYNKFFGNLCTLCITFPELSHINLGIFLVSLTSFSFSLKVLLNFSLSFSFIHSYMCIFIYNWQQWTDVFCYYLYRDVLNFGSVLIFLTVVTTFSTLSHLSQFHKITMF